MLVFADHIFLSFAYMVFALTPQGRYVERIDGYFLVGVIMSPTDKKNSGIMQSLAPGFFKISSQSTHRIRSLLASRGEENFAARVVFIVERIDDSRSVKRDLSSGSMVPTHRRQTWQECTPDLPLRRNSLGAGLPEMGLLLISSRAWDWVEHSRLRVDYSRLSLPSKSTVHAYYLMSWERGPPIPENAKSLFYVGNKQQPREYVRSSGEIDLFAARQNPCCSADP